MTTEDSQATGRPADPERAIVMVAHPDDADFVAAGTIAKWAKAGVEITLVVMTDGSRGSAEPNLDPEQLVRTRVREQRAAAEILGVKDVVFLGYEDGALKDSHPLRRDLVRLIRQIRPSRLLCNDPTARYSGKGYINHPDHIAGANAALAAVYPFARNRPSFPELLAEGLEPHIVRYVYLGGTNNADYWEDISETIPQKVQALQQHQSQIESGELEKMIREWAKASAEGHDMEYAEGFKYFELD